MVLKSKSNLHMFVKPIRACKTYQQINFAHFNTANGFIGESIMPFKLHFDKTLIDTFRIPRMLYLMHICFQFFGLMLHAKIFQVNGT